MTRRERTALITGANGFVGCHLARLLADKKLALHGTVFGDENAEAVKAMLPAGRRHECDLRVRKQVRDLVGRVQPDVVFHLAALSHVPTSWRNPDLTFRVNVLGTIALLDALTELAPGATVVLISSGDIYEIASGPTAEDTPFRPRNPYALSKLAADLLGEYRAVSAGLKVVRLRPFNHVGPGQSPMFVLPSFARQIARIEAGVQPPVLHVGNLDVERDFTDVRDMVRAYWLAARTCTPGECYNVASERALSIRAMLEALLAMSRVSIEVEVDPALYRPTENVRQRADASKFRAATGWTARIPIERTLRDILESWRREVRA
ncbi:MAG: GDP-mannose 4,6-dehydratase [Verrucomicrobia bacterium]|nr:GDP-mannose 4,6-dehydratase [Verrucomicrobiota bacterium]